MSIRVMTSVWEHSTHKGADLLLLLAIADHADDEGIAYPGIPRLARKTRMTDRNVQYALKRLTKSTELIIHPNAGPHRTHLYQVKLHGEKFAPSDNGIIRASPPEGEKFSGVKSFQGEVGFTVDGEGAFTQTIIRTVKKEKPSVPKRDVTYSDFFLEFWAAYPVKKKKGDAWKAWKQIPYLDTQLPALQTILNSIALHQHNDPTWQKNNGEFIPHPATYLRSRSWEDELTVAVPKQPHRGKLTVL